MIPYSAIIFWAQQPGNFVESQGDLEFLVQVIRNMDAAWLEAMRDRPAETIKQPKQIVSEREMSPDLFDAIFGDGKVK